MPVSEKDKEVIRQQIDEWKRRMMERYAPIGYIDSLDLTGSKIVLQRNDGVRYLGRSAQAWTLEREGHKGERYLLMLRNPSVWNARWYWELGFKNNEYTIIDASGVCLITHILWNEEAHRDETIIRTSRGQEYTIDLYAGLPPKGPILEVLGGARAEIVVRENNDIRWCKRSRIFSVHKLKLVDMQGNVVLSIGDFSRLAGLWAGVFGENIGPRLNVRIKVADPSVPNEVAVYLGTMHL